MRLERRAFVSPILLASSLTAQGPALENQASGTTARLQAVSAVSPLVVWVSGARGTYARTTDGGKTWHSAVVPGADSLEFRDVHAASADTAWLLSAGPGERSRIYHTTDAGRIWVLQFTNTNAHAFFDCLSFWDARRGLAVSDAVNGKFIVIRTDDGGAYWEPVSGTSLPPARAGEGMFAASGTCLAVHGDSLAWFGTGAGRTARVVRTTDGGRTWAAVETPIVHEATTAGITSLVFFDSRNGLALGGDLAIADRATDNVAATGDGGSSWTLTGRPTFPGPVYGAAAVPVRARWVVAVGPKGASWSADGGRTWRPLADGDYWSVGFAPDATGWMVGPEGRITRVAFGTDVRPWKPAGISSPEFESHAAFDPRTGDLWFVRSSPQFSGWRILVSRCTGTSWSTPKPPAFAGDGVEADPYFTPDGRSLYFISTRSVEGVQRRSLDIWRADRDDLGSWGAPTRLPEPVNTPGAEWFPRPGADGWLYFGSDRPGGLGGNDIWRARPDAAGGWRVENLGAAVNTEGDEYEPLPDPGGSRMILMADGDLYETRQTAGGWAPRRKLGPEVNQEGMEIGALFSPSGRSLLFARDTKAPDSGEFFVWYEGGPEPWPPDCPARAR